LDNFAKIELLATHINDFCAHILDLMTQAVADQAQINMVPDEGKIDAENE